MISMVKMCKVIEMGKISFKLRFPVLFMKKIRNYKQNSELEPDIA